MNKNLFLMTLYLISGHLLYGQNSKTNRCGVIENETYYCSKIGWKVNLIKGWTVGRNEDDSSGVKFSMTYESEAVESLGLENSISLLEIKKDSRNKFESALESVENYEQWQFVNGLAKKITVGTLQKEGFKVDSTQTISEKIDDIEFLSYTITTANADGSSKSHQLHLYSYINNYDFSVMITFTEENFRDEMLVMLRASKFNLE